MTTYQILVDVLTRITNAYSEEVESFAESCSVGGTGKYEDMNPVDVHNIKPCRELVAEAKAVLESINLS